MKWLKRAGIYESQRAIANPVRQCVSCLYSLGFGLNKIERFTNYNRGTSVKWLKRCGQYQPELQAEKRERNAKIGRAAYHTRRKNERFPLALSEFWPMCRVEKVKKPKRDAKEAAREYYHANKKAILMRQKMNVTGSIARRLRHRIWKVTRDGVGSFKSAKTFELTGCTPADLVAHLQRQFEPGMSWANRSLWDIDHIRPCASFDLRKPEDQRACFHFTNLQPLWRTDNRRKWKHCKPTSAITPR